MFCFGERSACLIVFDTSPRGFVSCGSSCRQGLDRVAYDAVSGSACLWLFSVACIACEFTFFPERLLTVPFDQ